MNKPQPTEEPLRQPDMFERLESTLIEMHELGRRMVQWIDAVDCERAAKNISGMKLLTRELDEQRVQMNNMIASMQRVIDGGV